MKDDIDADVTLETLDSLYNCFWRPDFKDVALFESWYAIIWECWYIVEKKKGVIKSEGDYSRQLSGGLPPTDEPTLSFVFEPIFLRNGPHNFVLM